MRTHTFAYVALLIENGIDCVMENCRPNNVGREERKRRRRTEKNDGNICSRTWEPWDSLEIMMSQIFYIDSSTCSLWMHKIIWYQYYMRFKYNRSSLAKLYCSIKKNRKYHQKCCSINFFQINTRVFYKHLSCVSPQKSENGEVITKVNLAGREWRIVSTLLLIYLSESCFHFSSYFLF
jgi:hypothetical protein